MPERSTDKAGFYRYSRLHCTWFSEFYLDMPIKCSIHATLWPDRSLEVRRRGIQLANVNAWKVIVRTSNKPYRTIGAENRITRNRGSRRSRSPSHPQCGSLPHSVMLRGRRVNEMNRGRNVRLVWLLTCLLLGKITI